MRNVVFGHEQFEVFGHPRRAVDRHGDSTTDRVTNACVPRDADDRVQLGDEIHGGLAYHTHSKDRHGALGAAPC
jgi:hypothetical protein